MCHPRYSSCKTAPERTTECSRCAGPTGLLSCPILPRPLALPVTCVTWPPCLPTLSRMWVPTLPVKPRAGASIVVGCHSCNEGKVGGQVKRGKGAGGGGGYMGVGAMCGRGVGETSGVGVPRGSLTHSRGQGGRY